MTSTVVAGSDATVPLQRRGPLSPGRTLVGGQVPDGLLDDLVAGLARQASTEAIGPRRLSPVALACGGAALVLVVLLVVMAVAGLFL